ncbi:MAG: hypothetical protein NVS1B4_21270 [Gemmatimonadaceae bacterium]
MREVGLVLMVATAAALAAAPPAGGQPGPQLAVHAEAITARSFSSLGGVGIALPLGANLRVDAAASAGATRSADVWRAARGASLATRFVVDPGRQSRSAAYAGAGVTARDEGLGEWRAYLLILLGVEGMEWRGVLPSIELGLGGGASFGIVLRTARPGYR